ncbi:hypothetical protein BHAP_0154 [Bifidobacterium hapali]|uniref:Uncharacterized protein n=1 Tax=Bifidobacterium hapali TaxID=1630172 RepID=A0A261G4E6_9BIFI|nr:hypothetical protein BHAP_0154 [Bifidobacterium hapali]
MMRQGCLSLTVTERTVTQTAAAAAYFVLSSLPTSVQVWSGGKGSLRVLVVSVFRHASVRVAVFSH